jgi:NtrC-family two-component system sensor histidine kinase KinB
LTFLYDPVIVTDAEGRIVFLNRAAEQIWGPTPETPCLPVVNEPYDLRVIQAIHKAVRDGLATGAGPEAPSVAINVAGVPKSFQLHVSPLRNEDGVNLGCVAVLQDVTHLKEVDRLKTEFIGVASHELRSPIQSLLLSAQLLEEGAQTLTAAQRDLVETQLKDLNRLDRLAGNLLDISKLEAGAAPPKLEAILPGEVLKSAAESLRFKAAAKSVTINLEESPNLPPVQADRSQIQQVLHNLADNAIRHSPVGGVVSLRAFSTGNRVTFLIEDNGEGIPPEYLKAILERFVQVPGATSGGAGLGLSIAQTLLNGHGAELRVQSEAGKGSSFSFELEAANSPAGKESI